jgi:predicted TIM-barrel fold metal-dependent hydrolase
MMTGEYINVHCHLLNFHFVPDEFFKTRAPIREKLIRHPFTRGLAWLITFILPGKKYNRLSEVMSLYELETSAVAGALIAEMDAAHIRLATPLMMDLEFASFRQRPEVPYRHQIVLTARIAVQYPDRIAPFVMIDPRRPGAAEMIIQATKELGFLGIKMYPPLGYHPYHKAFFNDTAVNRELEAIYGYCEEEQVPITAHCSSGGAYSGEVMRYPELRRELAKPSNWRLVLEAFPRLRLNLAHFGGDLRCIKTAGSWPHQIRTMLGEYENLYADLAYHSQALYKSTVQEYFERLGELLEDDAVRDKVLFGTDWSMTRHTWTESDYTQPFVDNLGETGMHRIAVANPTRFLLIQGHMPERVTSALDKGIRG